MSTMKKWIIAIVVVVVVVIAGSLILFSMRRVSSDEAEKIALDAAGGGEIVEREVESEGFLTSYSYTIVNGDDWYEIDLNSFGKIEEMQQGTGDGWKY